MGVLQPDVSDKFSDLFEYALQNGKNELMQVLLIQKPAVVSDFEHIRMRREAVENSRYEIVKAFLKCGMDPDEVINYDSLLAIAAKNNDVQMAAILLENGADFFKSGQIHQESDSVIKPNSFYPYFTT